MTKNETFYAAITVTDFSAFLKVPKYKLGPSLPAMVLLEQETRTIGKRLFAQRENIGEFLHSSDYLDSQYDMS